MAPDPYLVVFVLDPAGDEHAEAFADLAHAAAQLHLWEGPEPRAFDALPSDTDERTVGISLRVTQAPTADAPAIAALVGACAAAGQRLGVALEVQLDEQRVGELRDGAADEGVVAALRDRLGVRVD